MSATVIEHNAFAVTAAENRPDDRDDRSYHRQRFSFLQ